MSCDRYWLLTWTTYGSWLPGDELGSVTRVRIHTGSRVVRNVPDTPAEPPMTHLQAAAEAKMRGPAIRLSSAQAEAVLCQFHETSRHRGWDLVAAAVMANHCHVVTGVEGDPDPENLLRDYKAYASRRLNRFWKTPDGGAWWTASGSRRKLADEAAILGGARYVRDQEFALAVFIHPLFEAELPARAATQQGHLEGKSIVSGS